MKSAAKNIFLIVCTGGPCGGKTSVMQPLSKAFQAKGIDTYVIPEFPTIIKAAGFSYPGPNGGELLKEFEFTLFNLQRTAEDRCRALAAAQAKALARPAVLLLDRCLIDIKAYMPPDIWKWLLDKEKMHEKDVYDRYDFAVHLVTTADGAPEFYTLANNAARTEGVHEAVMLDKRMREVYEPMKHRWELIPNPPGGFAQKVEHATRSCVDYVMGELSATPSAQNAHRKPHAAGQRHPAQGAELH